jgi:hypothetical protein
MKFFLFALTLSFSFFLSAAPSNLDIGVDCSQKSFRGEFGENTYGRSLYDPQAAFLKATGDKEHVNGPNKQAPMLWALRVAAPSIPSYSFDLYDNVYGLSTKDGFSKDSILNFATYAADAPEENIISYVEHSVKELTSKNEIGADFNPLPFMRHVINQLDKQEKPQLISAMVFSSGNIEDRLREKFRDLLVDSSYLPIKWIFVVVGRDDDSSEITKIIKESKSKEKLFDNATSISMDRYFDFDGIGSWAKFDISDTLKSSNTKKFETDIQAFIKKDYEKKVIKLLKARETIITCRDLSSSLVSY